MTQRDKVLQALERAGASGITGLALFEQTGSMRFGARIKELRDAGHQIDAERVGTSTSGAAIYRYWLRPVEQLFAVDPEPTTTTSHYLREVA